MMMSPHVKCLHAQLAEISFYVHPFSPDLYTIPLTPQQENYISPLSSGLPNALHPSLSFLKQTTAVKLLKSFEKCIWKGRYAPLKHVAGQGMNKWIWLVKPRFKINHVALKKDESVREKDRHLMYRCTLEFDFRGVGCGWKQNILGSQVKLPYKSGWQKIKHNGISVQIK